MHQVNVSIIFALPEETVRDKIPHHLKIYWLYLVLLIAGCSTPPKGPTTDEASAYLDAAITLMQERSVRRHEINWAGFRQQVYGRAAGARKASDTYPAIRLAVELLGDRHSYFAAEADDRASGRELPPPAPVPENIPADIGYIRLPFCIGDETQQHTYIEDIRARINEQNHPGIKSWIIDLRGNFGGNMWPMLAAIGPILGEGIAGYFTDADGGRALWRYTEGKSILNDEILAAAEDTLFTASSAPCVAVLTDRATASSGEAIAVAFKGRQCTRSFGEATYGVSTGCKSHTLSDSARINLAESYFTDREFTRYGGPVLPDESCLAEEAVSRAIVWLYSVQSVQSPD